MSTAEQQQPRSGHAGASAEERAEELMERVTSTASRFVTRFVGRAREELEDIVAEARSMTRGDGE